MWRGWGEELEERLNLNWRRAEGQSEFRALLSLEGRVRARVTSPVSSHPIPLLPRACRELDQRKTFFYALLNNPKLDSRLGGGQTSKTADTTDFSPTLLTTHHPLQGKLRGSPFSARPNWQNLASWRPFPRDPQSLRLSFLDSPPQPSLSFQRCSTSMLEGEQEVRLTSYSVGSQCRLVCNLTAGVLQR